MNDNYLIHFGNKNSGRYPRGSGERPHQHDGLRSKIRTKKERQKVRMERREIARDSHKLSDEELNKQINRLQKEGQLKDLTKNVNRGRGETNKILKKSAGGAIGAITGALAVEVGRRLVKRVFGK